MPNPVGHFELFTTDMKKAIGFYSDMFGWKFNELEGYDYALIDTGELPTGGLKKLDSTDDVLLSVTVTVEDMEPLLKKAEELGGSVVVQKQHLGGDFGYYGAFKDPDGLIVGMWSST
ncbi:MAG TPA: VOC family protein [bacterium]|jgi:hypothetical protein